MWKATIVLAALVSTASPGAAAPAEDEPALAALVAEALAGNPDLRALEEEAAAAGARPAQARARPDPMVSLAWVNDGAAPSLGQREMTTLGVMVSQDLPWPGKRDLRGRIAERQADQAAQRLLRARRGVAASVRRAYHALRQARLLRLLVRDQGALWEQIEGVARARYTVGQGAQQDVLRTQIEVTRVGQADAEQQAEEAIRLLELNRLLGRAGEMPIDTPLEQRAAGAGGAAEPLDAVMARLLPVSPERAAARAGIEEARLRVDLARKEFKPDLTLQAGYMNRGGLDPMWQAGVGVGVPLARGRRRAALAQAESELRGAEARAQAVELQLRYRTAERLARLEAIGRLIVLYEQGVVPQGGLSVEAAVASYQAGRVPFISVLEALGTLYADRGTFIRLLAAQGQVLAGLEEASLEASAEMAPLPAGAGSGISPSMKE